MHRRPRLTPAPRLLAASLLTTAVLAGCSSAVEVGAPERADDPACADIAWPETVSGHERVATDPEAPWVAAWGDPAIIARCGLPALEPTTLECVAVNDVDWIVRELDDGMALITYSTDPALEVLVPSDYGPGALQLPVFTDIATVLPQTGQRCSGP